LYKDGTFDARRRVCLNKAGRLDPSNKNGCEQVSSKNSSKTKPAAVVSSSREVWGKIMAEQTEKKFEHDVREENPGLHLLYVKTAVKHLTLIDRMLQVVEDQANLNMLDLLTAMAAERQKLLDTNAAYADAQEILDQQKGVRKIELYA
jgi:uncharacterized 2Fe-2S/4Fe-4S cluster protein (DUF4445 family)